MPATPCKLSSLDALQAPDKLAAITVNGAMPLEDQKNSPKERNGFDNGRCARNRDTPLKARVSRHALTVVKALAEISARRLAPPPTKDFNM
ncbi:MAG TPA: hypothetical protein DF383_09595 [Deltaproteobacteria bacterium]|nr:hypothetical protein [Deltaproteobacteria bacterium]